MTPVQITLGIIQLIICVALVVIFAFQEAPDSSGLGALAGESAGGFFGKSKAKSKEKLFKTITIVLGAVFAVLTVVTGLFAA